ncbi:MAG TPA: VWA domain-containing protein [Burkholderiales bacterium]|nr:VWA domain-containing protein [Burkholderiales bacterium]
MAKLDEYEDLLKALGPHAREMVQSTWLEASRSFTPGGLTRYLEGAREIATAGLGWSVVLAYLRETPAIARQVGETIAFRTIDVALTVYARTDARTGELVFSSGIVAARRLGDSALFAAYLDFLCELAEIAPAGIAPILHRLDGLLEQLSFDGLRRWALLGVQSHMRDPNAQARYFQLDSEEGRALLRAEGDHTVFADVERRMSLYLRALWGRKIKLRPVIRTKGANAGRRSTIDGLTIRLPQSYRGFAGQSGLALYRAAAAHAAAHVVFTLQRFPLGSLKPLQVALVSLIEDARVEQLAIRQFPGLRRLWKTFHIAQSGGAVTSASLMARLARALIDEEFTDDDPWVSKGRKLFFEQRSYWEDQAISRALGGLLGNDMGQMRVQFNFKTYVVEPAYRDDNQGVWDFGDMGESSPDEDDLVMQSARLAGGEKGPEREEEEEPEPLPDQEEAVKLTAPSKHDEQLHEEPLSPPMRYDEWDYLIGRERPAWCTLLEKPAEEGNAHDIADILDRNEDLVNRVKVLVKAVQVQRPVRLRKRLDGDRLDLDACINATIDLRAGVPPDPRVHAILGRQLRDLSVLVLLDLSQSTNDKVANADTTVLKLAREATVLLADAMARIGDSFAIHGFSSNGRHDVGYYRFKDFDRHYSELSKARLAGMTGQLSTRMGTALRHAGTFLQDRRAHKKLILLVTDGEPSDIDVHDSQYLMFDAKKAVEDNARHGIFTYCMSLDPKADRYVSRIFGQRNYMVVDHIRRLPEKLPMLYMRVTN